jgi:hypothetical protein
MQEYKIKISANPFVSAEQKQMLTVSMRDLDYNDNTSILVYYW